ncbi:MAG: hypothetical protein AABX32_04795 [Nanoarchaeota archaeon]
MARSVRRTQDSNQGVLDFSVPKKTARKKPRSLEQVVSAEPSGRLPASAQVNDALDYSITNETLATFRSKVREVGKSYTISHEDHFNFIREVFKGVFSAESHTYGEFDGQYGVPHGILINLTPSEILSFYRSIGIMKQNYRPEITPDKRYTNLTESHHFTRLVKCLVRESKNYNVIRVMDRKEHKKAGIPPLEEKLSRVSQQDINSFYFALSQPIRGQVRQPYPNEPKSKEDVEKHYLNGIDIYIGKLTGMFHQLYNIKTHHRAA